MELATLRAKHAALAPVLTERSRRVWAATEAQAIGYGGTALVARATGIATSTIQRGLRELTADEPLAGGRTRRAGGGRKRAIDLDATLCANAFSRGDDDVGGSRFRRPAGLPAATRLVAIGTRSGTSPGACEQRQSSRRFRWTPRRKLVGAFKNAGRTWRPAKTPQRVQVHDFVIPATATTGGKAIPYGIYDLHRNEGWVSVGIDHDTASFAVRSIQRWWQHMGRPAYRQAQSLLITADAGGSNGARLRLWKWELSVWPIGRAW